jgi:hypothetical protein
MEKRKRPRPLVTKPAEASASPEASSIAGLPLRGAPAARTVIIGINYAHTDSALKGCVNDAAAVYARAAARGDREIAVLHDGAWPAAPLPPLPRGLALDSRLPTRAAILAALDWLAAGAGEAEAAPAVTKAEAAPTEAHAPPPQGTQASPPALLFFAYSGHGGRTPDVSGDERTGFDDTLVAVDGEITDDELRARLVVPLEGRRARLRALLDCCHSGSALDLAYVVRANKLVRESRRGPAPLAVDAVLLSGCRDAQTSADARFGARPAGALTHFFLNTPLATPPVYLAALRGALAAAGFAQAPQLSSEARLALDAPLDF